MGETSSSSLSYDTFLQHHLIKLLKREKLGVKVENVKISWNVCFCVTSTVFISDDKKQDLYIIVKWRYFYY